MNEPVNDDLVAALANCAREPVEAPGAIQPAGCLVCADSEFERVLQVSANIGEILGVTLEQAFDLSPGQLLGESMLDQLRELLDSGENLPATLEYQQDKDRPVDRLQATVYRSDSRWIFEIEPLVSRSGLRPLALLNGWIEALAQAQSRDNLLKHLVEAVENLAGYDRVMVYQFDTQWNGTVISETLRDGVQSFLGHRFPSADIPPQVRTLYGVNAVRSIPDTHAPTVSLISRENDGQSNPLDMGPGYLRVSSPVHLLYLANMGVGASLSVAIHCAEGLWGLLACHHISAKPLSPQIRDTVLALVQVATQRLFLLEGRDQMRYIHRVLDSRELVTPARGALITPDELVRKHGQDWLALFGACGLALISRFGVSRHGVTPDDPVLARIASRLTAGHHHQGPWVTDHLSNTALAAAGDLAGCFGLLALPINVESHRSWFLLFRAEQIRTHRWAGKPDAEVVEAKGRKTLTPRHSFSVWVEQVKGKSRAWLPIEVQAVQNLAEDLTVAVSVNHIAHLNTELKDLNTQLEALAHTDSLTGIWNRYHLEAAIDAEIIAAERYQRSCSVLLFDVDHFKRFNDRHGHEAGDRVLKVLADTVKNCLRAADRFGRWGGEEFLIITGVEEDGAARLGERIREQVAAIDIAELGQITASIGVARHRPGDNANQLVARADHAMYQAKLDGRNRVVTMR